MLFRTYAPTPSTSGPDEAETIYRVLDDLVRQAFDHAERTPESGGRPVLCGVGCGGPMAPKGLHVSPLNILGWREFPLGQRLAADHDLEVHIDNDAKALALAEWWAGAAQGLDHFVAMVVSTGVGGGVVLDGELLDGRLGNAGQYFSTEIALKVAAVESPGRAWKAPSGGVGAVASVSVHSKSRL